MKITAPPAGVTPGEVTSTFGATSLTFVDGVATTDELPDGVRLYMLAAGYKIETPTTTSYERAVLNDDGSPKLDEDGKPVTETVTEKANSVEFYGPSVDTPPAADSREVTAELVGTPLRDAAVDPQPGDFLPPVGAGEHDPHGPLVVAPGIHAEGERTVRPGPVKADPELQTADEQEHAKALLIDGEHPEPVPASDFLEHGGPLALSDPGSADAGEQAAAAGLDFADAAVPADVPEPKGNARLDEWQRFARSRGAADADLDGKSRDDLRAEYGS